MGKKGKKKACLPSLSCENLFFIKTGYFQLIPRERSEEIAGKQIFLFPKDIRW
jgi:sulfur relay (sulfurtransferase) DsrF/TusC family protein